jgi:hypothetical protein
MLKRVSTWGAAVVVIYFALIGLLFYLASDCRGMFCEAVVVLGIIPWSIIFEDGISFQFSGTHIEFDNMIWFWAAVTLNVLILYFAFAALQKWLKR